MRVVITGPSCSGKTSLINALESKGFKIFNEVARGVIKENKENGSDLLPDKDSYNFELIILKKQLSHIKSINDDELIFFDRGILDTIGYLLFLGHEIPREFIKQLMNVNYDIIFYLNPLGKYNVDSERWENEVTANKVGAIIKGLYMMAGFKVVDLPVFSKYKDVNIELRINTILDTIRESKTL